jgi:hypothetical protein
MTGSRAYWRLARMHGIAAGAVLSLVAWLSPPPHPTDQLTMERVGQGVIVAGCADLNCFRILVPATLEALPGPSLPRWRAYAVVANAVAAVAAGRLAVAFGLSTHAAVLTLWLSAMAAGSMGTVHHPYNADPFVLMLAPVITLWLMSGRPRAAGALAAIGIFAKEFAAAPHVIVAGAAGLRRDWAAFGRGLAQAAGIIGLWVCLQLALTLVFGYSYNQNPSSRLWEGGYLVLWLRHMSVASALFAVFTAYGALYLAMPLGFRLAPPKLKHLVLAAIPAAAAFVYVATPERAIGNFYYLVVPLAAMVLASLPVAATAVFVACFAAANLRIGAQIPGVPASRFALMASSAIAVAAVVVAWRSAGGRPPHTKAVQS